MAWWYVSPRVPSMMAPLLLLLPVVKLRGRLRLLVAPMIVAVVILSLKLTVLYSDFTDATFRSCSSPRNCRRARAAWSWYAA